MNEVRTKLSNCAQEVIPNLIKQGRINWSPLHEAAAEGNVEKLKGLLFGDIITECRRESRHGNTPLHEAAAAGYSRCVQILCHFVRARYKFQTTKNMTDINIQNEKGFTALHLAAKNGHNQCCRELLLAGADSNIQNYYGDAAIHTACRYGHAGAARILISGCCDINKTNLNGDTPLHISSAMGKRKLTRILAEADCELSIKNLQYETPLNIAVRKKHKDIQKILLKSRRIRNEECEIVDEKTPRNDLLNECYSRDCVFTWSPYGCHFLPDMYSSYSLPTSRSFPKQPLKKGEKYYLDLGGHVRKGPVGKEVVCYCSLFFQHIENEVSSQCGDRTCLPIGNEHFETEEERGCICRKKQLQYLTYFMTKKSNRQLHANPWMKHIL